MAPLISLLLVTSVSTSTDAASRLIDALVDGRAELPALADVQRAAEDALELTPSTEAEAWARRARLRGLVPDLEAGLGRDADLDVRASGESTFKTTTEGRQLAVDVGVRFELGELVFSDLELRASRERLARAASIQLARDRVTQLYFDRVELALRLRDAPTPELLLVAARLEGLLDALTGGRLVWPGKVKKR
ncbi:hypothetical protein L6R52_13440 [Myxococcota bacterium]|nr:hypothetical protein [Myxococcota bacterium]